MLRKYSFPFLIIGMLAFSVPHSFLKAQEKSTCIQDLETYHNRKGFEYFRKGFYDLAPKKKDREAEKNYQLAIIEFEKAIAADPNCEDAHRKLARVYYVQKDFEKAVKQYKEIILINPTNIDAHVLLSLAYIKLERYDAAVQVLENAAIRTNNKSVIRTINQYIHKIQKNKESR